MTRLGAIAATALLAACAPMPPPAESAAGGICANDNLYRLTGLKRSAAVEKTAREVSGARTIRWVEPGMMVTMDFRADRLTLTVDDEGKVTQARCG